jgi:hypothetical protein
MKTSRPTIKPLQYGNIQSITPSVLRHISVTSKKELKDRIMAAMTTSTRTRSSTRGLTNSIKPPDMIRTLETMN